MCSGLPNTNLNAKSTFGSMPSDMSNGLRQERSQRPAQSIGWPWFPLPVHHALEEPRKDARKSTGTHDAGGPRNGKSQVNRTEVPDRRSCEELIEEATVDCYDEDEQFTGLLTVIQTSCVPSDRNVWRKRHRRIHRAWPWSQRRRHLPVRQTSSADFGGNYPCHLRHLKERSGSQPCPLAVEVLTAAPLPESPAYST